MTENIISIIFINPHFVNPKINNFRSFFREKCRSDAVFRSAAARAFRVLIFGLSTTYPHCPPHAYKYQFDFCAFHTISCNRNQHYPQSVDNLVDNFRFCCVQPVGISNFSSIYAMYNVYISFPDFTHFGFSSLYPQFYQHKIPCYPQTILHFINRKIFYTFCG